MGKACSSKSTSSKRFYNYVGPWALFGKNNPFKNKGVIPYVKNVLVLPTHRIEISMDGKGRWMDNVFIQRLWRSIKYEKIRLYSYDTMHELRSLDLIQPPEASSTP